MEKLQLVSIILEVIIVFISIAIGVARGKCYGYGLAVTFAVYVFYDLSKLMSWPIDSNVLYTMFFVGTLSALYSVWSILRDTKAAA